MDALRKEKRGEGMNQLTIQIAQEKIKQAKLLLEEADKLLEGTKGK